MKLFYLLVLRFILCEIKEELTKYENYLAQISEEMIKYYANRCIDECDFCTYSSCSKKLPDLVPETRIIDKRCTDCYDDGINIFKNHSSARISHEINETSDDFQEIVCASSKLDNTLQQIYDQNPYILKIEIGFYNQLHRQYPGWGQCLRYYDPRIRPWYVQATAGPIDLLIVLDISGSMGDQIIINNVKQTKLQYVTSIIKLLLESFTEEEMFGIIVFNNEVEIFEEKMILATKENVQLAEEFLDSLKPINRTNFQEAMTTMVDVLNFYKENGNTSSCTTNIIIITDGIEFSNFDQNSNGETMINNILSQNYSEKFLFSTIELPTLYEPNKGSLILQNLACQLQGIYQSIENIDKFIDSLVQIYQFIAGYTHYDFPIWTQSYYESTWQKKVISVTQSIYAPISKNSEEVKLIGVVAISLIYEALEADFGITETAEAFIEEVSSECFYYEMDQCLWEFLRHKNNCTQYNFGPTEDCGDLSIESVTCVHKQSMTNVYCNQHDPNIQDIDYDWCYGTDKCTRKKIILSLTIGSFFLVIGLFMLILMAILKSIKKKAAFQKFEKLQKEIEIDQPNFANK